MSDAVLDGGAGGGGVAPASKAGESAAAVTRDVPLWQVPRGLTAQRLAIEAVVALAIASTEVWGLPTNHAAFMERDPAISKPFVDASFSTSWLVIFVVVLAPAAVAAAVLLVRRNGASDAAFLSLTTALWGVYEATFFTLGATVLIKAFAGRPRPNALAACNYAGYADALRTGNFTAYEAATDPLAVGDPAKCLDQDAVTDAFASFPSGHASVSMAPMAFLALFLLRAPATASTLRLLPGVRVVAVAVPLAAAVLIGTTRTRDNFHHYADILAGMVLGVGGAVAVFTSWYDSRTRAARGDADQSSV